NLLLTEDRMKLKLADFGMAWEKAAGEMKTCEASTYKWMASESYRKVPLECGRKKHYYQKAAFAVASKNVRPDVKKLPEEFVSLIESCWDENPRTRPEFTEISIFMSHYLNCSTSTPHLVLAGQALEHNSQNKTNEQLHLQLRISSVVEPDSPDTH
ncbi:hypothetical protein MKX03_037691, partial [Papaver bracteatum]